MPDSRPIGARLLALAIGVYSTAILAVVVFTLLSGAEITSYVILGLDCFLVVFGFLAARAIHALATSARWLFLGWVATLVLIGLFGFADMLSTTDSSAAFGLLFGTALFCALGALGFRYISRVSRPAV